MPTPDPIYQTFLRRAGAHSFDVATIFAYVFVIAIVYLAFDTSPDDFSFLIFGETSVYAYFILAHWQGGQTLGKKLFKVRVVEKFYEESDPSLVQCLLRLVPDFVFSALQWFLIYTIETADEAVFSGPEVLLIGLYCLWRLLDSLFALTNTKRRTLHDLIAGTVVLRTHVNPPKVNQS